jgi:hypothetical protein
MDPVDPRTPKRGVDWARRTDNHDWHAIAPCVENCDSGIEKPNVRMHGSRHKTSSNLRVTMRNANRMIFSEAQQDTGPLIAKVVY